MRGVAGTRMRRLYAVRGRRAGTRASGGMAQSGRQASTVRTKRSTSAWVL